MFPQGSYIVSGLCSLRVVTLCRGYVPSGWLHCVRVMFPQGSYIVSGLCSLRVVTLCQGYVPSGWLHCVGVMFRQGDYIVSGSWVKKNSLQLWDFNTMSLVRNIKFTQKGDGEYLYCAKFANNQTVLAGGSGTKSAQAINIDTDEVSRSCHRSLY